LGPTAVPTTTTTTTRDHSARRAPFNDLTPNPTTHTSVTKLDLTHARHPSLLARSLGDGGLALWPLTPPLARSPRSSCSSATSARALSLPRLVRLTTMASEGRTRCQVVVVGDQGTGKSSLITAVATDSFPERVPAVLPPTRLPHDFYPDRVPLVIIDTSSRCTQFSSLLTS
jgi:hypothetical protein